MIDHNTGTREEWLAARLELLDAEKELTRRSDELAQQRRELPWVRIDRTTASRPPRERRPSPTSSAGARSSSSTTSCSAPTIGLDARPARRSRTASTAPSSTSRTTTSASSSSRGPRREAAGVQERMGWSFPWASPFGSDFNHDFQASHTKEEWEAGAVEYNFRTPGAPAGDRREERQPRRVRGWDRGDGLGDVQA